MYGETPLHICVSEVDWWQGVQLLLAADANPNIADNYVSPNLFLFSHLSYPPVCIYRNITKQLEWLLFMLSI